MEARWQELLKKFDQQMQKDPKFAVPPSDDVLPAAKPKLLWQKGLNQWHVDAPLALSGDKLLVASAYLDDVITKARAGLWEPAAEKLYGFMKVQRRERAREHQAKKQKGRADSGKK